MRNLSALWLAVSAGRVDHVCEVPRRGAAHDILGTFSIEIEAWIVETDDPRLGIDNASNLLLRKQHCRLRVSEHEGQQFTRVCGIERHICAAGFQSSEH